MATWSVRAGKRTALISAAVTGKIHVLIEVAALCGPLTASICLRPQTIQRNKRTPQAPPLAFLGDGSGLYLLANRAV